MATTRQRPKWWTVIGGYEDGGIFVQSVRALTSYDAAAMMRSENGEELEIKSIHPGKIRVNVPDEEWAEVNDMWSCDNQKCRQLFTPDPDDTHTDGLCPTCREEQARDTEGAPTWASGGDGTGEGGL